MCYPQGLGVGGKEFIGTDVLSARVGGRGLPNGMEGVKVSG